MSGFRHFLPLHPFRPRRKRETGAGGRKERTNDALYRRTITSRLWLMPASLILCAPCFHYLGSSETLTAKSIAAAGFGLFSGPLMGNIFPAAFEVVPSDTRASAVGILNFFGAIISGFAALFGGMWKASLGIDRLLSITTLAYVAAGLTLVFGIKALFPRDHAKISISS